MRRVRQVIGLLAAGALVLGTGYAYAQQSTSTTSSKSTTPPATATTPSSTASTSATPAKPAATKTAKTTGATHKKSASERAYRGTVTAVDTSANPNTLVMNTNVGKHVLTVGVDVPPATKITEGKAKRTLADIKTGDQVWLRYDRQKDRLVAEQIRILPSGSQMTKMEKGKRSAQATPAATKSETHKKGY